MSDERVVIPSVAYEEFVTIVATKSPAWTRKSPGHHVFIRCQCGQWLSIDHDVDNAGNLNPSLWHDVPECGWYVVARLEGWQ